MIDEHDMQESMNDIAIVGMAGRFPGAENVEQFWHNLRDGVGSITFFSEEQLVDTEVEPAQLQHKNYVKARGLVQGKQLFDAAFFGFAPREAELMDPQHRLFLECAWEALESAGYSPSTCANRVGVYAGCGVNLYLLRNLLANGEILATAGFFKTWISNDKDFLTTRVSYKLNLKGPSLCINTACSTSLVTVHVACQSLLNGECDIALAGGITISPESEGYTYQEGGILSPDGYCRAFDAQAQGSVPSEGVGLVVLKRLKDAIDARDTIHALIKGSAINNDGAQKVGYTAPGVDGQTEVILEAQAASGVSPETITYIEAHGTGTPMGDPIEMAALNQAFRLQTDKMGFCRIGSVKSNIGHLDTAAGIAGLIKTVLALEHKAIPPTLHFQQPNPKIDFANSPFQVNTTLTAWERGSAPRRAGVSSLGIGGTNAHVILEEAPILEPSSASRRWQLLALSAKTDSALESATARLADYLRRHPDLPLADVAYTLQIGRTEFTHRRIVICQEPAEAVKALETHDPASVFTRSQEANERSVSFLFPGQGTQYVNMGAELYKTEPTFREQIDLCAEILKPHLKLDLRQVLYPNTTFREQASQQLQQTLITQPALFVTEYALANLWMSWGVRPRAMIGHSIGEYVAACLAGVFSLEDALALVARRAHMVQGLPDGGAMLSVQLSEANLRPLLQDELSLAAINGPAHCVVAGHIDAVGRLETYLNGQNIHCRRLHVSHAFHSRLIEPLLGSFAEQVSKVQLRPPCIPYLSNVTGTWITPEEATDPVYWSRHLRQTVLFARGIQELSKTPNQVLLEVGPGQSLSALAKLNASSTAEQAIFSSLPYPQDTRSDQAAMLTTLGQLWLAGIQIDWSTFSQSEHCRRIPLPTYPFERKWYWVPLGRPENHPALKARDIQPEEHETLAPTEQQSPTPLPPEEEESVVESIEPEDILPVLEEILEDLLGELPTSQSDHTTFLEMGADSILILQAVQLIQERIGIQIPPYMLFEEYPTMKALAVYIAQEWSESPAVQAQA